MRKAAPFFLAASLFIVGCRTDMMPLEGGNPQSTRRVLIAGESTPFKQQVASRVTEILVAQDCYFRIISLGGLASQDASQYGAILLVTSMQAGRLDQRVMKYLQKDPTNPKVVVFYTRGTEDPMPEKLKPDIRVDVVTSASLTDRVEQRGQELAALLGKRL